MTSVPEAERTAEHATSLIGPRIGHEASPQADAPGAECLTVAAGKITHMRIIFDRLPFDAVRSAAATAQPDHGQ